MADRVAREVWRITTPLPFRPRSVHAYLIRGSAGWVLVDGGANTDEAWSALEAGVRRVAGGWGEVRLHLVTHMHVDHVGLAERVRAASSAPLAMGRLDAERAAHAAAHPEEEAAYRAGLLRENGAPEDLLPPAPRGRPNPLSSFVPVDHALPEESTALPGAEEWVAVWTPGHTAGHTSLVRPGDRVLLAGDAVLPRITPTLGVNRQRPDPVRDYLEALARLERFGPTLSLAGHGDALRPVGPRLQELMRETRAEGARVGELLRSTPATAWALARERYAGRELPASAWLQALRETRAHLDRLRRQGEAEEERTGGVVRFRRP